MIADKDIPELQLAAQDAVRGLSIHKVIPASLDKIWPYVIPSIRKYPGLWNRYHTEDSLHQLFEDGSAELWIVQKDGIILMQFGTTVYHFPTGRMLAVFWGVGKGMEEWLGMVLSTLENIAARAGLQGVFVDGRLGWKLELGKLGYELSSARFIKMIERTEAVN